MLYPIKRTSPSKLLNITMQQETHTDTHVTFLDESFISGTSMTMMLLWKLKCGSATSSSHTQRMATSARPRYACRATAWERFSFFCFQSGAGRDRDRDRIREGKRGMRE